jgi:MFS family permease
LALISENNQEETRLPFSDCLKRPFNTRKAINNILLGGAVSCIPFVGGIVSSGYLIEYLRRVMRIEEPIDPPDWQADIKQILHASLYFFLADIIYTILFCVFSFIVFIPFYENITKLINHLGLNTTSFSLFLGNIEMIPEKILTADPILINSFLLPVSICMLVCSIGLLIAPFLCILYAKDREFVQFFNLPGAFRLITKNFAEINIIFFKLSFVWIAVLFISVFCFFIPIIGFVANQFISYAALASTVSVLGDFYNYAER